MNSKIKKLYRAKYVPFLSAMLLLTGFANAQAGININGVKITAENGAYLGTKDIKNSNGTVNINTSTIKIGGSITNTGSINVSTGTVEANGTAAQTVPANAFSANTVKKLVINNAAGVTLSGAVSLTDVLSVDKGTLASNGYLTLKSSATNTARIAPISSVAANPISGNVMVERYIPAKRAYRLLTVPVTTPGSIKANWMEGVNNPNVATNLNPNPGYGTHITGAGGNASGFDATNTNNPSMWTFNNTTQSWSAIPNTAGSFAAGAGYRVIIRGDRSVNLTTNTPNPSPTVLRASGTVVTGTVTLASAGGGGTASMPTLSNVNGGYTLVGNPYASPVNWCTVQKTNVSSSIYLFDPNLGGASSRGGFVSFNGVLNAINNPSSNMRGDIQSGQAFFVQTTAANPSVVFKESDKNGTHNMVFRGASLDTRICVRLFAPGNTTSAIDGVTAVFSDDLDNNIADDDSYKFNQQDENIAIMRGGAALSIEGRKMMTDEDTMQLKVWQLTRGLYTFNVKVDALPVQLSAYLEDLFESTATRLDNNSETLVSFSTTGDSASFAPGRFRIVFKANSTLAVDAIGIKAYQKGEAINIDWTTTTAVNVDRYEIEKSANGNEFFKFGNMAPSNNNSTVNNYQTVDRTPFKGDNYYRVKCVSKSGEIKYSAVAKVRTATLTGKAIVSPNPVEGGTMNVVLNNAPTGSYKMTLLNSEGKVVLEKTIGHSGSRTKYPVSVKQGSGIYELKITGIDYSEIVPVFVP